MSLNFQNQTLARFSKALGSASPAPGGGAAAAVTGALGAALLEMTSRINARRAGKTPTASAAGKIRTSLLKLARKDAEAYLSLSRFRGEARKKSAYQSALKKGAAAPMEIGKFCAEALRLAEREIPRTSRWLASDLAEAALLLEASLHAARWNAEINLGGIKDGSYVRKTRSALKKLESEALKRKKRILGGLKYR